MADKRTLFMGEQAVNTRQVKDIGSAAYTLVADDVNSILTGSGGTARALTIPPQADVEIPIGSFVKFVQLGTGAWTFTAGSGVTLRNGLATAKPLAQYASLTAWKIDTDT